MTWTWEPYLPVGSLALLSAFPTAKTSTGAWRVGVPRKGRPWATATTSPAVNVDLPTFEEHRRDVRRRLAKFGLTRQDPVLVHSAG